MYHYERKFNEDGDEIVETIDTPLRPIISNSELVRLQNPDSYHINIVPLEEMKKT